MRLCIESHSVQASQQLRLLELCFQYSFLNGRAQAGQLTPESEERLVNLRPLFEGDRTLRGRRRHHRYAAYLPAAITTPRGEAHGILLNFSSGGMLLATLLAVDEGDEIQVLLGGPLLRPGAPRQGREDRSTPGRLEYLFTCVVTRAFSGQKFHGLACQLTAAPLELRAPADAGCN